MNDSSEAAYQEIECRLASWARDQKDVRALIVVGSRATPNAPRDSFSDLDVLLVAGRPSSYVDEVSWLEQIEHPWLTYVIQTPLGGRIARGAVFREGRVTVDFAVVGRWSLPGAMVLLGALSRFPGIASWLPSLLSNQLAALSGMLRAGTRVLVDKDGAATRLARTTVSWPRPTRPSEREFAGVVRTFWGSTFWTAKKLLRRDLWRCTEGRRDVRQLLLQMVEWHARAIHGWDYETWYLGRYVERWADPRIVRALPSLFSGYDLTSQQRALVATANLFQWISDETSARLGFSSNVPHEEYRCALELLASPSAEMSDSTGAV
ncbi:MAG TPA: aminoglycoside 6-adenylyltransferase [Candidatus Eisenbacteria bacterium]|nr:aminoglycoside 6-adenylyltransferase [Candidatus Eisenbacteria bacterium]